LICVSDILDAQHGINSYHIWMGLRKSLPWYSGYGEDTEGCGFYTDGTICVSDKLAI